MLELDLGFNAKIFCLFLGFELEANELDLDNASHGLGLGLVPCCLVNITVTDRVVG